MPSTVANDDVATLYQALKQYRRQVRNDRRLPVPPADSVTIHDTTCGSQVTLDARFEDDRLAELGYRVRACSLGQATTAILANHAAGLEYATFARVYDQLRAILDGQDTHCDWPELEIFALTRNIPGRQGSAELPFRVLEQLFDRAGIAKLASDGDATIEAHPTGGNKP